MKVIHTFCTHKGEKYKIIFKKKLIFKGKTAWGLCDEPSEEELGLIQLNPIQPDYQLAISCCHEMLHAFYPDKSETSVNLCSKAILRALKKIGFIMIKSNIPKNARSRSLKA